MLPRGVTRVRNQKKKKEETMWLHDSDADCYSSPQVGDNNLNDDLGNSWQGRSTSDGNTDTAVSLEMGLAGPGKYRVNDERPSYSVMS